MDTPDTNRIQSIVHAVVHRITKLLGADGSKGLIVVALTGATSGLSHTAGLLRQLVLDRFRLLLAFSPAARSIYGEWLKEQLGGFPHVEEVLERSWLLAVREAKAVICPQLSLNTLSKLALLLPDNVPSNVMLHALFVRKPCVVAVDGAHPGDPDRALLGLTYGTKALHQAVEDRLETLSRYGFFMTKLKRMRNVLDSILENGAMKAPFVSEVHGNESGKRKVITAADVQSLAEPNVEFRIPKGAVLTPLAREILQRKGVVR